MSTSIEKPFTYAELDCHKREEVKWLRDEIRTHMQQSAAAAVEVGRKLLAVKEMLPHGRFGPWLKAERMPIDERTAQRWMQVARHIKTDTVSEIRIPLTTLYLLTCQNTPPELRAEIIEEAEHGQSFTREQVKERIAARKALPPIVERETPLGLARRAATATDATIAPPTTKRKRPGRNGELVGGNGKVPAQVYGWEHRVAAFWAEGQEILRHRPQSFERTAADLLRLAPGEMLQRIAHSLTPKGSR